MPYNAPDEKVEKITRVEGIGSKTPTEVSEEIARQNHEADVKVKFDQAFAKVDAHSPATQVQIPPPVDKEIAVATLDRPSPMAAAAQFQHSVQRLQPVTLESIVQQANNAQQKIQANMSQIEALPESTRKMPPPVPPGDLSLASNHLVHIDTSLRSVNTKLGVEVTAQAIEQAQQTANQSPLVKFLGYLSHADYQLSNLLSQVNELNSKRERFQPGDLMAIQIKVSFVQQEVELFSNLLNQTLTAIKTVMNVQV